MQTIKPSLIKVYIKNSIGNVDDDCGNDNAGLDEPAFIALFVNASTRFSKFFSAKSTMVALLDSRYLIKFYCHYPCVVHHRSQWVYYELI
jgi:hypothetical protein